jgi:hypothetical protein
VTPGSMKMLAGVVVNARVSTSQVIMTLKVFVIPATPVKFASVTFNSTECVPTWLTSLVERVRVVCDASSDK